MQEAFMKIDLRNFLYLAVASVFVQLGSKFLPTSFIAESDVIKRSIMTIEGILIIGLFLIFCADFGIYVFLGSNKTSLIEYTVCGMILIFLLISCGAAYLSVKLDPDLQLVLLGISTCSNAFFMLSARALIGAMDSDPIAMRRSFVTFEDETHELVASLAVGMGIPLLLIFGYPQWNQLILLIGPLTSLFIWKYMKGLSS